MTKNILLLIILLVVVAGIILGIHYLGSQVDNKKKYQHPITRPGASW
ncbi:hypothetical protein [Malonomonas rubra]|nr:hypothetical protein [Malonomonas rubra]